LVQPPDGPHRPVPAVPHRRRSTVCLRRTSLDRLRRNFQWPGIASLVLVVVLFAAGIHKPYPLISFGFCLFVALTVIVEFYKGASSIAAGPA